MQVKSLRCFGVAIVVVGISLASVAARPNAASAVPLAVIKTAVSSNVEVVGWRGRGWGWGAGAGFYRPYYRSYYYQPYDYYPRYYYYPVPAYYYPRAYYYPPVYTGISVRDAVAYCMQRFQSYDLRSGTYLGYDGYRHPCP